MNNCVSYLLLHDNKTSRVKQHTFMVSVSVGYGCSHGLAGVPCFRASQAVSKMSARAVISPLGSTGEGSSFKFTRLLAAFSSIGFWTEGFSFLLATGYPKFLDTWPSLCGRSQHDSLFL